MKKPLQIIYILLVALGLTANAQTIKLEQVHVPIFDVSQVAWGGTAKINPGAAQAVLNNYAAKGYTLVSSQVFYTSGVDHTSQNLLLIFQKIDPPSEQEIKKLLDKSLLDIEKKIREQLVTEINELPTKLDTDKEFLAALYNQIKSEIASNFILIEKSNDIKTLDDYKKSLYKILEAEFDLRYKRK